MIVHFKAEFAGREPHFLEPPHAAGHVTGGWPVLLAIVIRPRRRRLGVVICGGGVVSLSGRHGKMGVRGYSMNAHDIFGGQADGGGGGRRVVGQSSRCPCPRAGAGAGVVPVGSADLKKIIIKL